MTLSETTATMDGDLLLFVKVDDPYEGSLVIEVCLTLHFTNIHFISLFAYTGICKRKLCFDAEYPSQIQATGTQS